MTFALVSDLESHIERRHTQAIPPTKTSDHSISILLEEQIDMALTLKQFKDSVTAQLSAIQNDQENIKVSINQLSDNNAVFCSSSITLFESFQSNLQNQISNLVSTFAANPSPPPPTAQAPPSGPPRTSPSTSSSHSSNPVPSESMPSSATFSSATSASTRTSLEDPVTKSNVKTNHFSTQVPKANNTLPPKPSTQASPKASPQASPQAPTSSHNPSCSTPDIKKTKSSIYSRLNWKYCRCQTSGRGHQYTHLLQEGFWSFLQS